MDELINQLVISIINDIVTGVITAEVAKKKAFLTLSNRGIAMALAELIKRVEDLCRYFTMRLHVPDNYAWIAVDKHKSDIILDKCYKVFSLVQTYPALTTPDQQYNLIRQCLIKLTD
jgi:hypothetical protein